MKTPRIISALLAFAICNLPFAISTATAQTGPLKINPNTGAIVGPVTGATFISANSLLSTSSGFADGTSSAPGIKFSSDTDTGFYRIGSNNIGITAGTTVVGAWSTTGLTLGGPLDTAVGSAAAPILSFGATGDGFYTPADNQIGIGIGGNSVAVMSASAITLGTNVSIAFAGTGAATTLTNLGATTVGGNLLKLTNPGAVRYLRINADNTVTARTAAELNTDLGLGTLATKDVPVSTSYKRSGANQTLTNGTAVTLAFPTAIKTDASFNGTTFTAPATGYADITGMFDLSCTVNIGDSEKGNLYVLVRDATAAVDVQIIYDNINVPIPVIASTSIVYTAFPLLASVPVTSGHAYQIFCTWDNDGDDAITQRGFIQWEMKP